MTTKMTKMVTKTAQQGDVLLRRVDGVPVGAKRVAGGSLVLAEGETTGHAHRLQQAGSELFELNRKLFVKLVEPATLTHEEHKPITLEAGVWEVGQVQEWDYLSRMVRAVRD